ncbi:MAG: M3 family metallopeptidase [Oscillatoriales cyanobacterium SM2_2_1]|nr:M3 family metallopeptidase [Oscillatoriales cyanobacterium SM2_2_1]
MTNPLLIGRGIPPYTEILPEHVVPGITTLLGEVEQSLTELEQTVAAIAVPCWEDFVEPLEHISERIGWAWGVIEHLLSVKNSAELREVHRQIQPQVIQFFNRFSQSRATYEGFKKIRHSDTWEQLDPAQQRIVTAALRDAELSGVSLDGELKEKFNQIQMELANLSTQFSNHVLDATKAFSMTLTQPEEIEGLPNSLLAIAAQAARLDGDSKATPEAGPWCITLDFPSYAPFMQHSRRRNLREKLYRAFVSRAASGDYDNNPLIQRILDLRQQKAEILGFPSYGSLSLTRKMAGDVTKAEQLLEELRQQSVPFAQQDLEDLREFARRQGEQEPLQHWDIGFWSERLRESKFEFTAEELRPYFPLEQVLSGLFGLIERLFGVRVVPADGETPVWHPDVRYFKLLDEHQESIASFYLDPYSRPAEKRGGAWMNDCLGRVRRREGNDTVVRKPVAYLVCNQSPPVDDKPSLMTFGDVTTLFHEFGHGLQHMLTHVDYAGASGINNIEWDAVELPSQFMENWCYDRSTLMGMAKHYQSGETLPEHYYQKLLAARNFMSGSAMLRQLHFAMVDLELHHRYDPRGAETPAQVRSRLAEKTMVLPPLPEDQFLCAFSHIFAGGYAAGYYSYKWAEVLSADAFAAFEEAGLDNEPAIAQLGRKYRQTILGMGGSAHPMVVFESFRGRQPSTEPLLRHSGLLVSAA